MSAPKKVLHLLNAAGGGAALSTLGLIHGLRARGVESCAVCHDAGTAEERQALRDATGGEVLFLPLYWWNRKIRAAAWKRPLIEARQWARTGGGYVSAARIAAFAAAHRAELLHTNTLLTPEGGRAASLLQRPHVWHVRELIGPGQPFQLRRSGARLGAYLRRRASMVVANSEASAAALRAFVPPDRLKVIPNAIELSAFERARAQRQVNAVPVVAMVANVTSRTKRHELFIDAAALLSDLPVAFRIYGHLPALGEDGYADALRGRIRAAGLEGRLSLMGHRPAEQIMGEVDVLVHPAENESFGRVVIEAMAAGLPVVGSNGGGVAENVRDGETGLLFRPLDPRSLADAIRKLASDEALRRRMGEAGRRTAERYSLQRCVEALMQVYATALERPLRPWG